MKPLVTAALCLILIVAGCATYDEHLPDTETNRLTREQVAEDVLAAMDLSADPCEDFYRYSCGGWLDNTERPADQARWVRSFSVVREQNREVVRSILEDAAEDPGTDPDRQRIGWFYGSCMDEEAIEARGATPLDPIFERIAKVEDAGSLFDVTGYLHRYSMNAVFGGMVVPDFANPDLNIVFFMQGGLGMPDRDYYVSDDPNKQELLTDYEAHVARMFGLLGEDDATAAGHAADVLAIETRLAEVSRDRARMRNLPELYNKIDIQGLKELTPSLPWDTYLESIGHPDVVDVSVATPEFFEELERLVADTEPVLLQTYLRWHAVDSVAGWLSSDFVNANFEFYGKKVNGQEEIRPRWKRCVDATQGALGEAVGKLYVERMFAGDSKRIAEEMIGDLKAVFRNNLPGLVWMDEVTRGRAEEKLTAMGFKIGYPDKWRDYSSMKVAADTYYENALAAMEFEFDRQANKIGNPVDREEWIMTPQTVNAANHPLMNEMTYPAGILQPPFFHRDFPAAMNYGGIGGGIGHEMTHGYDDQGRLFNPHGQMQEWWEPEVAEKFNKQAECVEEFYSGYEIEPGTNINGKLTLGENIADIGGLKQSYDAYKLWEERHGAPEPLLEELTNDQLLFVAWGQVWCSLHAQEQLRVQVTTDPHSPSEFRVNGPVSHNPAFASAFGCEVGTPMHPEEQCLVW